LPENENDDDDDDDDNQNENPLGLNSTEIIAELALELVDASKNVHNPINNRPFELKFGNKIYSISKYCCKSFMKVFIRVR
jgi:hypothetical protein